MHVKKNPRDSNTLTQITFLPSLKIQEARRRCPPWYVAFARTVHQVLSLVEADRPVLSPNKDAGDYFFFFFLPDRSVVHLFLGFLLLLRLPSSPGGIASLISTKCSVMRCRQITNPLSMVHIHVFNTNDSCSNRSGKNEASHLTRINSLEEASCSIPDRTIIWRGDRYLVIRDSHRGSLIFNLCSQWLAFVSTICRWWGILMDQGEIDNW